MFVAETDLMRTGGRVLRCPDVTVVRSVSESSASAEPSASPPERFLTNSEFGSMDFEYGSNLRSACLVPCASAALAHTRLCTKYN